MNSGVEMMQLPAFQNLLAKIETNYYRNRPNEAAELKQSGALAELLQKQAEQTWEILATARRNGMPMFDAQELIADLVYPPLESDE